MPTSPRQLSALNAVMALSLLSVVMSAAPAQAQVIEWVEVANVVVPAWVGTNTIARQGNQITFDAITDSQYVRYSGNCQTEVLYRLKIGGLDLNNQPQNVSPYPNEKWFSASDYQSSILATACDASQ